MTTFEIRSYITSDRAAVIDLALRAWAPVFNAIEDAMEPVVYEFFHPDGWREKQKEAVSASLCEHDVWVAKNAGNPVGFVSAVFHHENGVGEIHMIAVDPEHQRRGIATALSCHALEHFRQAGLSVAMVETGGDPGHAAARRTYEKAGFGMLAIARYFKKL